MLNVRYTSQFKKDFKLALKRGKDEKLFVEILNKLRNQESLPEKNKDHQLTGNWNHHRECHIESDWLLIYSVDNDTLILELVRMGTHSDLFGK